MRDIVDVWFQINGKRRLNSLHSKKHRKNSALFLVEGEKVFSELISSNLEVVYAAVTEDLYATYKGDKWSFESVCVDKDEIRKLSSLVNNYSALAVVQMPVIYQNEKKEIIPWHHYIAGQYP